MSRWLRITCIALLLAVTAACGNETSTAGLRASSSTTPTSVASNSATVELTPITFPVVNVPASDVSQAALDYTKQRVKIMSGTPTVVLTMPVTPPQLQSLGLGIGNYSPACQRPMYLAVVKGDFDTRGAVPSVQSPDLAAPARYIGYVFDLGEGKLGGVIATIISPDGASFKPVLHDDALPDPDLAHAPRVAGPPYVPCRDIVAPGASATPTAPTSVATRGSSSPAATPTGTSAAQSTGPIRTADEAAARALWFEHLDPWADPDVAVSHVAWMTLGEAWTRANWLPQPPPGDPSDIVWWIDFSGTFPTPSCPAPPPGTPSTGCGPSSAAVSILAASDGHVIHGFLGAAERPVAASALSLQIPSNARLQTPGAAIDAGIQTVPGKDGKPASIKSFRLLTLKQLMARPEALNLSPDPRVGPNDPVWEFEFTDATFSPPCLRLGDCSFDHVFTALDAITGDDLGWWSPGPTTPVNPDGTPSAATPSSSPAVTQTGPLPDALINHNSSGDHVSIVSVTDPARLTLAAAMGAVAQQVPWGNGGGYAGKPVTIQAWYGNVSIGNPGPNGTWGGPANIPLPSGEILPNLRGRLVWLLDYGNVPGMVSSTCSGCAPPPVYDHDVYAVDDETGAVLWWASYKSP